MQASVAEETTPRVHVLRSVAEVEKVISMYEIETRSAFIVYKKDGNFGSNEMKSSKVKVYWERKGKEHGGASIPFDGVPFVHVGEKILWCHQGKDKRKKKQTKPDKQSDHCYTASTRKRSYVQVSKKKDCPAAIYIQQVAKFPNFKVERDTAFFRNNAAKQVHKALSEKKGGHTEMLFILKLPHPSTHKNHITGRAAGIREPVDPIIKNKIVELSSQGVRKVSEMRRHLEAFVKRELDVGGQALEKTRRRFYPTNKDIYNHMYLAKVAHRFSTLDQENVDALIVQWKKESPADEFFFRPYCGGSEAMTNNSCINDDDITPDEVPDPMPSASEGHTLLFCHQTAEQRELLKKYGDQMCLMDATYRTTKYALPLFFLCVRTNVRYQVVGSFVIQYENILSIEEALQVFKNWNPTWKPGFFMVDFAEEEIQALERVFPESKVLLCDFHREKAWLEWTSKGDNGTAAVKDDVLSLLRNIAHAGTTKEAAAAVQTLKKSTHWAENEKLRNWFGKKWLPNIERWCQAYRNDDFVCAVNTNNGIERQNESLKYEYLEGYKNCSLSEMLTVLITQFAPDSFRKYLELNVQYHDGYRGYDDLPQFLVNRPRQVVAHVMNRWESDVSPEHVSMSSPGLFSVKSASCRQPYEVRYGDDKTLPHCQCTDWKRFRLPCKHMCACMKAFPGQWGWEQLGSKYTSNPLFNLDEMVIFGPPEVPNSKRGSTSSTSECVPVEEDMNPSDNDVDQFEPLLPRKGHGKSALRLRCRNALKEITSLTFLIKNKKFLECLADDLNQVLRKAKDFVPQEGGIHVIIESPKKSKKRKTVNVSKGEPPQKKKSNILDVKQAKYGRKKHPFTNRVGQHADSMRKMYQVHVPISATSTNNKSTKRSSVSGTKRSAKRPKSASVQGSQPAHAASVKSSQPAQAASVQGSQPAHAASVKSSQPAQAASVQGSQPAHAASLKSSQPAQAASVQGSQPAQAASVQGSQPAHAASVKSSQPAQAASVQGSQPAQAASVQGSQPAHAASVKSSQSAHAAPVQGSQPAHAASVKSSQPAQAASVQGSQPAQAASVQGSQPAHAASVKSSQPAQAASVQGSQPAHAASLKSSQPAQAASVQGSQPAHAASVKSSQPAQAASVQGSQPAHAASVKSSQPAQAASNIPKSTSGHTCIDLTKLNYTSKMKPQWIPDLGLSEKDKNILLSGQKLTDNHISAAQKIIKKQFPHVDGLIDTVLVSNNDIPSPPTQEALQIHHIPGHWLMSTSFGGAVTVYDSSNTTLAPQLRRQLARVYSPLANGADKLIEVKVQRCQQQIGGKDCGLFAIANTIALANGVDPATVRFQQTKMRKHLQQCLENHTFTMFPHSSNESTSHRIRTRKDQVSLHCLCHKHYPGSKTFQCTSCKTTFHTMCVYPNSLNKSKNTIDICPTCKD
ncbi:hypothetical protein ACROYT_G015617 [Oculina patagonica]